MEGGNLGEGLSYERGGDARQKIWTTPRETNLGIEVVHQQLRLLPFKIFTVWLSNNLFF